MMTTERLFLREHVEEDWRAMREMDTDPEVQRYRGGIIVSEDRTREYVRWTLTLAQDPSRTRYPFAIILRAEDRLIGACGLNITNREFREAEVWYVLQRHRWGNGYITEAAGALLQYGFEELGLHRIWAQCVPENVGSARVMEKIGMQREGHLRETYWMHDRWWDALIYSVLDHEWKVRQPSAPTR
jgi:[ribosomal protein S5]-alanine N-acetyltransferase